MGLSHKKYEIHHYTVNGTELLFASESLQDIRNKLKEPAIQAISQKVMVQNNLTGGSSTAGRVLCGFNP